MNKKIIWLVLGLLLVSFVAGCAPAAEPAPQVVQETVIVKETVPPVMQTVMVPAPTLAPAPTVEAGPVTMTVYDPTGAIQVSQLFAPRLADLNGKTICEFMNGSWESARTFPVITQMLKKMFPTANIIESTTMPAYSEGNSADQLVALAAAAKKAGCQAAILGNAG